MFLEREEYIEQAFFFRTIRERLEQGMSTQEILTAAGQEALSTTKLPLAIDFMAGELKHTGAFSSAMARLAHYFTPFQTFVVREAEKPEGRFDFRVALEVMQREAEYRAQGASQQGVFLYEFETLCRNRLGYDYGLEAIAGDPIFDDAWRAWIATVRHQVGIVDIADMIYVRSEHYRNKRGAPGKPVLFGEKEGKIALANRQKDPLYLFAALARHLGYPSVPRQQVKEPEARLVTLLARTVERLETRLKLLEEEIRGGINLSRFYGQKNPPSAEEP